VSQAKHIPFRRCVICRESLPQKSLLRMVQKEGSWQFDLRRKALGRGSWLCLDHKCHELKSLKRFFKQDAQRIASEIAVIKHALGDMLPITEVRTTDNRVAA
jgi:predicted RNA-binding protein YlxR (DUF448 family)